MRRHGLFLCWLLMRIAIRSGGCLDVVGAYRFLTIK